MSITEPERCIWPSSDSSVAHQSLISNDPTGRLAVMKPFLSKGNGEKRLGNAKLHKNRQRSYRAINPNWTLSVLEVRREVQQWVTTAICKTHWGLSHINQPVADYLRYWTQPHRVTFFPASSDRSSPQVWLLNDRLLGPDRKMDLGHKSQVTLWYSF